ncbi:MAG: zf-HC2 domain-containing protein [Desulfobacterales bacterium]|nr:zf-HC2 domain-containing protein [Desulfobacterales bacterium]
MNHPSENQLHAFVDNTLSPQTMAQTAHHLKICPACHEKVREIRELFAELHELPTLAPSSTLTRRIFASQQKARFGNLIPVNLFKLLMGRAGITAVAAGLLAGIILGFSVTLAPENPFKDGAAAIWSDEASSTFYEELIASSDDY